MLTSNVKEGSVNLVYVESSDESSENNSDAFTKPLGRIKHEHQTWNLQTSQIERGCQGDQIRRNYD